VYNRGLEHESNIAAMDRLVHPLAQSLPPEGARAICAFRADSRTQARIDELADKCNEGQLSPPERQEYEAYVDAIDFIAILQDQAREALENATAS
jgi:uncharacterized protein YnzC (UPF0291/DUF896 family)